MTQSETTLHATTVSVDGQGVVICGPSGAGKSSLALQLVALGATLVADDRTCIHRQNDTLIAHAPDTIAGLIEARGVGLLQLPQTNSVPLVLSVDMGRQEMERLPQLHQMTILGLALTCLHNVASAHFPAAILLYLKGERKAPS